MSLFVWQRTITDDSGEVVPNAQITVRDQVSSTLIQLYEDIDGQSGIGNPFNADEDGFARFYAENGRYRITAAVGESQRIWEDERLGTAGEDIKYRQTTAESTAGVTPTNYQYPAGDTRRYTTGIVDALAQAAETGGETRILFGASETISTGLVITTDYVNVRALPGAILTYSGTGVAVTLGSAAANTNYLYFDVPLRRTQEWDDGTDTTSIGLQVRRVRYSHYEIDAEGFNIGYSRYGITGGNVHNTVILRHLQDNRVQIRAERDGGSAGWNNDEVIMGGRIGYRSGTIDAAITNAIITKHYEQVATADNGPILIGVAMELAASGGALPADSCFIELNGQWNRLFHCRIELSGPTYTQLIKFGASSLYNIVDVGRAPTGATTASQVTDNAGSNSTNRVFGLNSTYDFGLSTRARIGAIAAIGRPSSSLYGGDAAYDANFVGQNLVSAAGKTFAGLDGSNNVVFGVTGTGRFAIGKDPAANLGHFQLIDEGISDKTLSRNETTWARTTTDDSGDTINIDSIVIPDDSTTLVEMSAIARHNDGSKVWTEKRTACISKNGTSNCVIEEQTAYATHDPDTFAGSAVVKVTGAQLQILVTGVAATTIEWTGDVRWQSVTADS